MPMRDDFGLHQEWHLLEAQRLFDESLISGSRCVYKDGQTAMVSGYVQNCMLDES